MPSEALSITQLSLPTVIMILLAFGYLNSEIWKNEAYGGKIQHIKELSDKECCRLKKMLANQMHKPLHWDYRVNCRTWAEKMYNEANGTEIEPTPFNQILFPPAPTSLSTGGGGNYVPGQTEWP